MPPPWKWVFLATVWHSGQNFVQNTYNVSRIFRTKRNVVPDSGCSACTYMDTRSHERCQYRWSPQCGAATALQPYKYHKYLGEDPSLYIYRYLGPITSSGSTWPWYPGTGTGILLFYHVATSQTWTCPRESELCGEGGTISLVWRSI